MTQTKLEILGPYTPEHPGPFCTRDGRPVRILTRTDGSNEYPIVGYVGTDNTPTTWTARGYIIEGCGDSDPDDLMSAREVPVAREFWVNEYRNGGWGRVFETEEKAAKWKGHFNFIRTIHFREVLPESDQ